MSHTVQGRRRRRWETRAGVDGHTVIVHLTASAFLYGCTCGITGPLQPTYAAACEDSQQHLDQTVSTPKS